MSHSSPRLSDYLAPFPRFRIFQDDSQPATNDESEAETMTSTDKDSMDVWVICFGAFVFLLLLIGAIALFVNWIKSRRRSSSQPPEKAFVATTGHSPPITKRKSQPSLMRLDSVEQDPAKSFTPPYSPITSDSDYEIDNILTSGKLEFAFNYDEEINVLKIHLIRAIGLPNKRGLNIARYVEVYLLPFRTMKGQTKIKEDTSNPIFNEQFVFENIPAGDLSNRTLQFCVFEYDEFSRHNLIGEVLYTFEQNSKFYEGAVLTRDIKRELVQEEPTETSGAVLLSMCYLPTASRLTFVVLKAKITNIKEENGMKGPDLYVKTTLRQNGKRIRTTKTAALKGTVTPIYNEAFVFDLPTNVLSDVAIVVRVIDNSKIGKSSVGHVTLGPHALTSMGIHHWKCMVSSPRKPIAQWHPLMI